MSNEKINQKIEIFLEDLKKYKTVLEKLYDDKINNIRVSIQNVEKNIDNLNDEKNQKIETITKKINKNRQIANESISPLFAEQKIFNGTIVSFNNELEEDLFEIEGFKDFYSKNEDLEMKKNTVRRLTDRKKLLIDRIDKKIQKEKNKDVLETLNKEKNTKEHKFKNIVIGKEKKFVNTAFEQLEKYKINIAKTYVSKEDAEKQELNNLLKNYSDITLEKQEKIKKLQEKLDLYQQQYKNNKNISKLGYKKTLTKFYEESENDAYKNVEGFKSYRDSLEYQRKEVERKQRLKNKKPTWEDIISL